jgi:excisionase family DNA binding protein
MSNGQHLGRQRGDSSQQGTSSTGGDPLVLSVATAAQSLGVSDDLVYELIERGQLPCLRLGRRKPIPRRAIELLVESAMDDFDPEAALNGLRTNI